MVEMPQIGFYLSGTGSTGWSTCVCMSDNRLTTLMQIMIWPLNISTENRHQNGSMVHMQMWRDSFDATCWLQPYLLSVGRLVAWCCHPVVLEWQSQLRQNQIPASSFHQLPRRACQSQRLGRLDFESSDSTHDISSNNHPLFISVNKEINVQTSLDAHKHLTFNSSDRHLRYKLFTA